MICFRALLQSHAYPWTLALMGPKVFLCCPHALPIEKGHVRIGRSFEEHPIVGSLAHEGAAGERYCMKHVAAHYDGEKVVLDEPVSLPANTPVEVVVPDSLDEIDRLKKGLFLASLPSLKKIWDNPDDAVYDTL